ncbi:hypothetical protein J6590_015069 [Homalodisca vitripennis]|nr:hypothetical protein J6590_015069 [Homalodisca vitripennis]
MDIGTSSFESWIDANSSCIYIKLMCKKTRVLELSIKLLKTSCSARTLVRDGCEMKLECTMSQSEHNRAMTYDSSTCKRSGAIHLPIYEPNDGSKKFHRAFEERNKPYTLNWNLKEPCWVIRCVTTPGINLSHSRKKMPALKEQLQSKQALGSAPFFLDYKEPLNHIEPHKLQQSSPHLPE